MQDHRSAGELAESPANPSPAIGNVHGLGESHALRVDLQPIQVPWLAEEVDSLRATVSEELAIARARPGPAPDVDEEIDRRVYQLRVGMRPRASGLMPMPVLTPKP